MYKYEDRRFYNAGENPFHRWGKKAQARAESFLQPNKNGWYSFPVDGDQYWTIGTSKGKYGEFAKINDTIFSVNSAGCMYAKARTEKGELFVKAIRSLIDQMKKEIESRAVQWDDEEDYT